MFEQKLEKGETKCLKTVYYIKIEEKEGGLLFTQKENQAIHCTIYSNEVGAIKLYLRNLSTDRIQIILIGLVNHTHTIGYSKLIHLLVSMGDKLLIQFEVK